MVDTLGYRLKQLRESKHLKQEQVASLIDVTRSAVCAYENDTRQPSLEVLVRLANLYRVSTDFLLGCQTRKTIDVTGLTTWESAIISDLVVDMTEKNKKLGESDEGRRGKRR